MKIKTALYYCQSLDSESCKFGEVEVAAYNLSSIYPHYRLLYLQEIELELEVPDPREAAVEVLEKKITTVQAEAQVEVTKIKGQIQTLLALEAPALSDDLPF